MTDNDLDVLSDPVAKELLDSTQPAHLAYTWSDGSPRVVPIWFHWTGAELVMATPARAPKNKALRDGTRVAVTIDAPTFPYHVLSIRGTVSVSTVEGVVPEYAEAAKRYFGEENGTAWIAQMPPEMESTRIAVRPEWATVIDFETRFPSALGGG
jgi:PPOX class probable F420-dependent enzyme